MRGMGLSKCFDTRDELGCWNCVRAALGNEGSMGEWFGAGPVAGGLFSLSCMGVRFGGDYALPGATESYRTPAWECGPAAAVPAGGVEELGLCLGASSRCPCGLCPASLTLSLYWAGLMPRAKALRYGGGALLSRKLLWGSDGYRIGLRRGSCRRPVSGI